MRLDELSAYRARHVCRLQKWDILSLETIDALGTTALPPGGAIVAPPCLQCLGLDLLSAL